MQSYIPDAILYIYIYIYIYIYTACGALLEYIIEIAATETPKTRTPLIKSDLCSTAEARCIQEEARKAAFQQCFRGLRFRGL